MLLTVSEISMVTLLAERECIMLRDYSGRYPPFIEVGHTDKVVFTQAHVPERLDLRTTWQQSQEAGATIPCFMGSPSAR